MWPLRQAVPLPYPASPSKVFAATSYHGVHTSSRPWSPRSIATQTVPLGVFTGLRNAAFEGRHRQAPAQALGQRRVAEAVHEVVLKLLPGAEFQRQRVPTAPTGRGSARAG